MVVWGALLHPLQLAITPLLLQDGVLGILLLVYQMKASTPPLHHLVISTIVYGVMTSQHTTGAGEGSILLHLMPGTLILGEWGVVLELIPVYPLTLADHLRLPVMLWIIDGIIVVLLTIGITVMICTLRTRYHRWWAVIVPAIPREAPVSGPPGLQRHLHLVTYPALGG